MDGAAPRPFCAGNASLKAVSWLALGVGREGGLIHC